MIAKQFVLNEIYEFQNELLCKRTKLNHVNTKLALRKQDVILVMNIFSGKIMAFLGLKGYYNTLIFVKTVIAL